MGDHAPAEPDRKPRQPTEKEGCIPDEGERRGRLDEQLVDRVSCVARVPATTKLRTVVKALARSTVASCGVPLRQIFLRRNRLAFRTRSRRDSKRRPRTERNIMLQLSQ